MSTWHVLTPPFDACDDRDECERPIGCYEARDYLEVEAPTRREAVQAAVKRWLAELTPGRWSRYPGYCVGRKQDGLCPWTGIRAYTESELVGDAAK